MTVAGGGTPRLVLASRSPRRHEALHALGLEYKVVVSDAEERLPPAIDPADPVPVARAKAEDVAARRPDAVVLAADTIVVVDGVALGKPASPDDARRMLRRLRGRRHHVRTGVAVARGAKLALAEVACPLLMRRFTEAEIDSYVVTGEPLDCAGAYDVHRRGGRLIERIDGCFATVVGLPIVQAATLLDQAGVRTPADPAATCTHLYGRRCLAADPATRAACLDPAPRVLAR